MTSFEKLFGARETAIRTACVLLPFARRNVLGWLGVDDLTRGDLYGVGEAQGFSVIHTGMGALKLGQAVLHLSETAARDLILFGACGLTGRFPGLEIGSLVSIGKCHADENMTRPSLEERRRRVFRPDHVLHRQLFDFFAPSAIQEVAGGTVASPRLGQEMAPDLHRAGIQVIDLECSALFSAAEKTGRRAAALLYVTDIAGEKPYYTRLATSERASLFRSIQRASQTLCAFIREKLTG